MYKTKIAFAILYLLSATVNAFDDDDLIALYDEEELISIATGTEKHIRFAPSVASVITKDDIKIAGYRTLSEALQAVPGFHISDSLLFDDDLISIRGIRTSNNPQVMLLIDGVEVKHLFSAARPAGFRLPLNNVERIEVIRGPGSAIYGADAFSGVINVITQSAADMDSFSAGVRAGSFNTQDAWVQSSVSGEDWGVAFSMEYTKSEGDHNRLIERDALGLSGSFRSEYEIYNTQIKASLGDFEVRLHNWHLNNGGNGAGGAQILDPVGDVNVDYYQLDLGYSSEIADDMLLEAKVGYNKSEHKITNRLFPQGISTCILPDGNVFPESPPPADCASIPPVGLPSLVFPDGVIGNPGGDAEIYNVDASINWSGLEDHSIRIGVGYVLEDLDTFEEKNFGPGVIDFLAPPAVPTLIDVSNTGDVFVEDVDREVFYVSLQDEWAMANDWTLTFGVRYDKFSDVGDTFNPRLALVWAADYNLTAKLLYGRAFRAPSFTELYSQNNPTQIGNEDLDPEVIDTAEMVVIYDVSSNAQLSANLFHYQIDDLIDFVGGTATNAIDQKSTGIELAGNWELNEQWSAEASFMYQEVEDKNSGNDVADVPNEQGYLSVQWRPGSSWRVMTSAQWIGDRGRAEGDTRSDLEGYVVANLAARVWLGDGIEIGASVKNLFDRDGKEPSELGALFVEGDFPIEGRSAFVDVSMHF